MQIPCVYIPGPAPAVSVANRNSLEKHKIRLNDSKFAFYIEYIYRLILKPWSHTFSPTVIWKNFKNSDSGSVNPGFTPR